jgi:hypothetical protein
VLSLKKKYEQPIFGEIAVERLLELQAQIVDPTNTLMFTGSQLTHTLQVLESMEKAGITDREFLATTLIHDLGKLASLSLLLPEEFPFQPNWRMDLTHPAFWELFPTIDHVVPIARGGADAEENWVTTSQLRNSAKANWTLDELSWVPVAPGDIREWDGLSQWFVNFIEEHPDLLGNNYLRIWLRAAKECLPR